MDRSIRVGRKRLDVAGAEGATAAPLSDSTADGQQEPAANGIIAKRNRAVTKALRPSADQANTNGKQHVRLSKQQPGEKLVAAAATGTERSKRTSQRAAKVDNGRDNKEASAGRQQKGTNRHKQTSAESADEGFDDGEPNDQSGGNSSNSGESDSDGESEQEAAARKPVRKRATQNSQQGQQRKPEQQPQKPAANSRRSRRGAAADGLSHSRRAQKGPLSRVRAVDAAPVSSNTTTTTSTQLLGGAARPIPEITSYHQAVRRVNHQIQRISTEEHLLQTYTADGWKGAR